MYVNALSGGALGWRDRIQGFGGLRQRQWEGTSTIGGCLPLVFGWECNESTTEEAETDFSKVEKWFRSAAAESQVRVRSTYPVIGRTGYFWRHRPLFGEGRPAG
jgi:hypothetical protein